MRSLPLWGPNILPKVCPANNCLSLENIRPSPVDEGLVNGASEVASGEDEHVGEPIDPVQMGQQRVHHPHGVRVFQVSWVLSGAGSPLLVSGSAFAQSLKLTIALLQEVDLEREKTSVT